MNLASDVNEQTRDLATKRPRKDLIKSVSHLPIISLSSKWPVPRSEEGAYCEAQTCIESTCEIILFDHILVQTKDTINLSHSKFDYRFYEPTANVSIPYYSIQTPFKFNSTLFNPIESNSIEMTLLPFTLTSLSEDHLPGVTRSSSEETPSVDDSFGSYHTTASSVTDKYVPTTPEGLRPRQSLQEVREALGVHSRVLQELDQLQANLLPSRLYLPNASTPTLLPCLPPLRHCDVSPMASKSSFYSRASSSTMVAESPNFHLGQTRTAVGALVARNSKPYSTFDDQLITSSILPPLDLGVLSPRTMIDQDEDDVYSEPRSIGYHELDDSMEVGTPRRFLDQANSAASHTTASFQASPIRRTEPSNKDDMSFSSQLGLVEFGKGMHMYNFDPIVAVGDQLTNVSAMSHSMVDDSSLISYGHTVQSKDSAKHFYPSKHLPQYLHTMDADLMLRKQHNQRKAKEKLLCDVVTRLQDDMELMDEVEKLHDDDDDDGVVHWFIKTNFDEEGLLTGYSETSRIALLKYFQSLLTEIDTAQSDEFYLSPSQRGEFRDSHDDLRQTLSFMVRLIETSPCKVQRWVCHKELRVAMGIPAHSKCESLTLVPSMCAFSFLIFSHPF